MTWIKRGFNVMGDSWFCVVCPFIRQEAKGRGPLQAKQLAADDQLMRGQRFVYITFMNDSSSLFSDFQMINSNFIKFDVI